MRFRKISARYWQSESGYYSIERSDGGAWFCVRYNAARICMADTLREAKEAATDHKDGLI